MQAEKYPGKLPWANRFQRPTPEQLLAAVGNKQLGQLATAARGELARLNGVAECLEWSGVPWRWTLVYGSAGASPPPLAYLILDPARPQIAVPLNAQIVDSLPLRRLKRFVRDGIAQGRTVAEVRWACWEFAARSQLDEIMDLVVRKHKLAAPAATAQFAEPA